MDHSKGKEASDANERSEGHRGLLESYSRRPALLQPQHSKRRRAGGHRPEGASPHTTRCARPGLRRGRAGERGLSLLFVTLYKCPSVPTYTQKTQSENLKPTCLIHFKIRPFRTFGNYGQQPWLEHPPSPLLPRGPLRPARTCSGCSRLSQLTLAQTYEKRLIHKRVKSQVLHPVPLLV